MVQSTKTFRVFVSSTFSDLKEERNILQKYAFPRLRELCAQHGFKFQAIDLRWGISEEAGLDHQTMNICLQEIKRSQEISPKPNFIILLGDRYGWRPLPSEIPYTEFEEILAKVSDKDKRLLAWNEKWPEEEFLSYEKGWYRKDENACPAVYCLKPRIVNFSKDASEEENKETKDKEAQKWLEKEKELKRIFLDAIDKLVWAEDDKRRLKYEASATELEIIQGVLNPPKDMPHPEEHVFAFFRKIKDADKIACNKYSKEFLDFTDEQVQDKTARKKLDHLKDKIREKLNSKNENDNYEPHQSNVFYYDAEWNGKGISTYHLTQLCEDVYNKLKNILMEEIYKANIMEFNTRISQNVKGDLDDFVDGVVDVSIKVLDQKITRTHPKTEDDVNDFFNQLKDEREKIGDEDPIKKEIVEHEDFGKEKANFFTGREKFLDNIINYLSDRNSNLFALYGDSGSGKSALMAAAVQKIRKTHPNSEVVVRFIGTTNDSKNIKLLLENLCIQINKIYKNESIIPQNYTDLIKEFQNVLSLSTAEKPLIIVLDSLDQLSDDYNAKNLEWLPFKSNGIFNDQNELKDAFIDNLLSNNDISDNLRLVLSNMVNNTKIIVSTSTQPNECLSILKNEISDENLSKLEPMKKEDGDRLLDKLLDDANRTLQSEQRNEVLNKFEQKGLPLYLKLVFEEAKTWKSYNPVPDLASDIHGIISQMFKRLSNESNHGKIFVDRSMGYLAASKNGLSEDEIIDILSRDKAVFYDFMRRARSEPTEILTTIQKFLDYEDELKYDSEKLFKKLQKDKNYCDKIFSQLKNAETSFKIPFVLWSRLHFELKPYLVGRNINNTLIFSFFYRQLYHTAVKEFLTKDRVDRHKVLSKYFQKQEFEIINVGFKTSRLSKSYKKIFNIRKISELPYQQTYSEMWDELEKTLTDIKFIELKCNLGMINDLIEDYNNALITLQESAHERENIPNKIIFNNIKNFSELVNSEIQSLTEFNSRSGFILQTAYNHSLERTPVRIMAEKIIKEGVNEVLILNLPTKWKYYLPHDKLLENSPKHTASVNSVSVTSDGKMYVSCSDDNSLRIWNLETGKCEKILKGHENFVRSVNFTPDCKLVISGSSDKSLRVWDLQTGECEKILGGHEDFVNSIAIAPEGKKVISGSSDGTVRVWDLHTGECEKILEGHSGSVLSVCVTPDGKLVLSGSSDGTIRVWDLHTGECEKILGGYIDSICSISVIPEGIKLISGDNKGLLNIWDLKSEKYTPLPKEHDDVISDISITHDSGKIITGSPDKTVKIWDMNLNKNIALYKTFNSSGEILGVSPVTSNGIFVIGTNNGETIPLAPINWTSGLSITTPVRLWLSDKEKFDKNITILCSWCNNRFKIPDLLLNIIKKINNENNLSSNHSPCLELPHEVWEDPRLILECPNCNEKLKINPFIVDTKTKKSLLKFWK